MGWGPRGVLKYLPSRVLVTDPQIPKTLAMLPEGARVLDVGAGGRRIAPGVVTFDATPGPHVDLTGDIHALPIPDASFDCVFCTGTLEHVARPWDAVRELSRVLKPGGMVHVDVPFIQGYHPDPVDYWRFTLDGLCLLCKEQGGFQQLGAGVHIGPTSGLVWIAREWVNSITANRVLSNLLLVPTALLLWPLKYLDYLLVRGRRSHHVASAFWFRGQRL